MPQQVATSVENNFTKGLITESTGLNFPENAATDTDNCLFTIVGDVSRREGINLETNFSSVAGVTGKAITTYVWNNAGGDGSTRIYVRQNGATLQFYNISTVTTSSSLSGQVLVSTVDISQFAIAGTSFDGTLECQYADGNGYLFVFNPGCEPFYCTYASGTITANLIAIQIRDFAGIPEPGVPDNLRPLSLSNEHKYNLLNQGWVSGNPWSAASITFNTVGIGAKTFYISSGLTITSGQSVIVRDTQVAGGRGSTNTYLLGTVSSYTSSTGALILSISSFYQDPYFPAYSSSWSIVPYATGYLNTWQTAVGNNPSNADVWWYFKNASGVFDPATTQANTTLGLGPAPKGHNILNAFTQQRSAVSGVPSLTDVVSMTRPRTGTWYQGRVWYTGVDASAPASGDATFTTWTESIYFSQIITNVTQFGKCYQTNDPTSDKLFGLLSSDGGVVTIQGSGSIYKLFPLVNALIVFAANGVWYITGSQGIGFSANDYTIVKLSGVKSISSNSFVSVNGMPYFWNEEGIYSVEPAKQGTSLLSSPLHVQPLEVNPITVGTILTFYDNIPVQSKKYARGDYNPIDYVIQWTYRDTLESSITDRYNFNKILNFNVFNKSFYPYTVSNGVSGSPFINGVNFISYPQSGPNIPLPGFKYSMSYSSGGYKLSFAEENDFTYLDWNTNILGNGADYVSYFITGYKIRGQAVKRFQPQYIQVYSRTNNAPFSYKIQGIWDFAGDRNSGRWSSIQLINSTGDHFNTIFRRHKIRGNGYALQFKVSSASGQPFDIQGWAVLDTVNVGT